jgi:uncharacterized protein (DUF2126 family)/transglutaminase-like putative cysteine protease
VAITVGIEHTTTYRYDRPVAHGPHVVRLRPAPHARTPIRDYSLTIRPDTHRIYWQADPFGNRVARVVFPEPMDTLSVEVRLEAEMTVLNPFDFFVEAYAEKAPFRYDPVLLAELAPYFEIVERGPRLLGWVGGVDRRRRRTVEFLVAVNSRLQGDVGYAIRMDPGVQTCEETLASGIGSCRDSAWLLVQILRHLGFAARFASGYLVQLAADEPSLDGPSGPEQDFTDLHAWAEAFVPGAGWIGLDPTSGLFAGEGHIPLACTPDPVSAAPITGAIDPCEVAFEHRNVVRRVHEDPRVTKPYTDADWAAIRALGRAVDAELARQDVRLTLGGEPTFVSIDDMESAQWNTEALGAHKWERAVALLHRLRTAFAPGAVLHFGQGKWYPGEPLPRWALGCHWRRDGRPLWADDALVAADARDYGVSPDDARRFGRRLAERLGVDADVVVPACEDWVHHLWREASRPIDVDPVAIPWAPEIRDDCSTALARGLDRPVGHVLPLAWDAWRGAWHSAPWRHDGDVVRLVPGSSPMGLRLPLGRLPAVVEIEREEIVLAAPAWRGPEVGHALGHAEVGTAGGLALATRARPEVLRQTYPTAVPVPYTACCLEVRAGRLCVFMPPIPTLEPYAALLAAIEATAAELGLPVLLEGYEPPASPDLRSIRVTPDPGVIEVNVHPAASWDELEATTVTLYEAARLARLGTEKFMLDGRHTGTGGGNHVTLGAATPSDSPFLRRPDLLRSLLTYWQHHPALSYLFSGLFIGPTSQAPRVDEAGSAGLVELERSLAQIEGGPSPWVVDRTLRSFLCDLGGNTHRTEFSIDKLWSADGPSGRQGLLELRAFEMPPHAQMSLAQMLLVRALVARFWTAPYRQPLARWTTTLADRFLLPYYVWADLLDVLRELETAGYPFRAAWYEPFFEFRFPVCGRATVDGVELELRTALEPWLVLGEDATAARQARVVDSAVERLQVACRDLDPSRHVVTCNGRRLPLTATGVPGEFVAGVRFKAWALHTGMHPTIGAHGPLVFDVIERGLGRAVGGCVYHVAHPGGLAYEAAPLNAFEAESRRISRFWSWGHSAGHSAGHSVGDGPARGEPSPEPFEPDFPTTLDLRRMATGAGTRPADDK